MEKIKPQKISLQKGDFKWDLEAIKNACRELREYEEKLLRERECSEILNQQ